MDYRRLFDLFGYQEARFSNETALAYKRQGQSMVFSTRDCRHKINQVSAFLLRMGLRRGERVAIMAKHGSPFWNFLDFGMQQIGLIVVPLHATSGVEELRFILQDAAIRACFTDTEELYATIHKLQTGSPDLEWVVPFYPLAGVNPCLLDLLAEPSSEELETIKILRESVVEDDLATIIYTSGTTGKPKGVMLSHKNVISNIKSTIALIPVNCDKKTLSFLPLSHIFERMVIYTYIAVGASVTYAEGQEQLLSNLREVRPHYITAVPLIIERLVEQIMANSKKGSFLRKRIIKWAIELGKNYYDRKRQPLAYWLRLSLARILVFNHWRKMFGGRVEGIVVGAAALNPVLGRLFSAAGLKVREGYGLTETSPVIAFNRFEPGGSRFGTVGMPIPGVEVRIVNPDEEGAGEVQVKGPNVMLGYYQQPEASREVITEDGWFRTGDVGMWVHKRFLKLKGRQDDMFKTGAGKFIAPEAVEKKLYHSEYISQCLVAGASRPAPYALIVPRFDKLEEWCKTQKVHWTAPQFMVLNPRVRRFFEQELARLNQDLPPYQQVQQFLLLHEPWTEHSGEMTATLKLRRKRILETHLKAINELYS